MSSSTHFRWAVAAMLVACGSTGTPASSGTVVRPPSTTRGASNDDAILAGRAPTMRERQLIVRLTRQAEETRGLRFLRPVPVRIQTRQQALAHLFRELEQEELDEAQQVYTALGLLPAGMDIRQLLERVLGEQVAGYYDQDVHQLVVRDEVIDSLDRGTPQERAQVGPTILHELVHALQDQHLQLADGRFDDAKSDTESAYQSLVEGDATLAMLGHFVEAQGLPLSLLTGQPDQIRRFADLAMREGRETELQNAPAILRVTLLSSYSDGLLFCAALHRRGGWEAINQAHLTPPVSTEQVLHPSRYFAGEVPDRVEVPPLPSLVAAGYRRFHEDSLGELELGVYFGQPEDSTNPSAADGWSGDALAAYRRAGHVAVVWFSAWDSDAEADEAEAAARAVQRHGASQGNGHLVLRTGRALLILRGVPASLHPPIVNQFRHFAAGLPAAAGVSRQSH